MSPVPILGLETAMRTVTSPDRPLRYRLWALANALANMVRNAHPLIPGRSTGYGSREDRETCCRGGYGDGSGCFHRVQEIRQIVANATVPA